jgi:serine/threonine protein kinase
MGITYKAFDVDLRRFAALKVISPPYLADEAVRSRFLREARAAGSVRHPNVASVFQLGTSQENYFYAMEFVEGETISRDRGWDFGSSFLLALSRLPVALNAFSPTIFLPSLS